MLACCETDKSFNHLVYEYAAGGTLTEALESDETRATFKWQRRVGAIVSLVHALQYCHKNNVKHRDVKPANICFQDEDFRQLLLIDFGIATEAENTGTSYGGTHLYMAPEYKLGRKYYDEPQEVYSVGVVMISLVTGKTSTADLEEMMNTGCSQKYLADHADSEAGAWNLNVLQQVCKLAHKCICGNPQERPTFKGILANLAALRSQFTTQVTGNQASALQHMLSTSFHGSTCPGKTEQNCACGGKSVGGITCRNLHYQCLLCLECSVKRQMGSENICCQIGRCDAIFETADLVDKMDEELLAEHALQQSRIHLTRIRDNHINKTVKNFGSDVKSLIVAGFRALASGRAHCPSLCVLWPCRSGRLTAKPMFCKEYQLHFLCAFDRTPTKSSILVVKRRKWVKKVTPILKYSIMAFKLINAVYGIPVPLPECISPGDDALEKLAKLTESLSDVVGIEDFQEWSSDLANLEQNLDETSLKKLLYQQAEGIDAEAYDAIAKIAHKEGNLGWKDEMSYEANANAVYGWVKNDNVKHWKEDR